MATTALFTTALPGHRHSAVNLRIFLTLLICMGLPVGLFGLVNIGAEAAGIMPFFFAPFGLPGWAGGIVHLVQLALLGAAFFALMDVDAPMAPRYWLVGLTLSYIALPYVTLPLDSLQLSILCTALFLLGLATMRRVGVASPLAGWLMTPMLAIVGFSATLGLVLTAAYTPPFALIEGQNPPPASA